MQALCRLSGEERSFAPGELLFEPGAEADHALLLTSGRLAIKLPGVESIVADVWPGELVGETALMRDGHRGEALVLSVVESTAVVITPALLDDWRTDPAVVSMQVHLVAMLSRRIHASNHAIQRAAKPPEEDAPQETLAQRLKRFLREVGR